MIKQKGYIGLTIVVFMLMLSMIVFPWKFIPAESKECRVGQKVDPLEEASISLPPINNVGLFRYGFEGGPDLTKPDVEYVLIRKNAPVFTNTTDPNYAIGYPDYMGKDGGSSPIIRWPVIADSDYLGRNSDPRHTVLYREANQPGFDVYYANATGEVETPTNVTDRAGHNGKFVTLRTEGFLMFVHLGPDGEPIKLNYGLHIYYLVDFYQDKSLYLTPDEEKGYNIDDIFHCLDPDSPASGIVLTPEQEKSTGRDQLQLEWFILRGTPGMYAHCKPAVYLYPEKRSLVNVKVYPRGELSYTDPPYDKEKGWTVWAEPTGDLYGALSSETSAISKYDYLYYESKLFDSEIKKPEAGWVVKGVKNESSIKGKVSREMQDLFERVLPELGLNEQEKADFENYWLGTLPDSPYYFVGLMGLAQRDYLEPLSVTPKPDTSIRFSLYFEPLSELKSVEEPIIQTPQRRGFTLVDWGGMIKLHKDTPFTCSQ